MNQCVVITGLGVCTPLGHTVPDFWRRLLDGCSGIGPVTLFDASALRVRIGGEVQGFDPAALLTEYPESAPEKDRKVGLGLDAAHRALVDSGLPLEALREALLFVGVSLETFLISDATSAAHAGDLSSALVALALARGGPSPLQTPLDRLTQLLGDHYGFQHGRYTNCSACAAGAQVVGEAFRRLRAGRANVALAGATDSPLNPLALGGFSLLRILSEENDRPGRACRPFDATRQGTVLAEGAAFMVLETREHARRRGARVCGEIIGYGSSLDAYRVTDPEPDGRGAVSSMTRAILDAGVTPAAVDCVNAHGTGTPKNDVVETRAIKQVLGDRAGGIPVTANKSMTGHMIATSGALEAVASVLTLYTGKVPPTINRNCPDPECDLDYVAEGCRDFAGRTVLSNSFGFGGQNASLLFRRFEP
ncbi:MAG TPA: beta-ketoacyl-[acyl-carrier-protein] synthase family protein [Verrucomicrobiota bacterium]|nr:beta-ketoacyl-[acyl-carrier-protein] synthase family protein [Verrucomicrobiota bacterium]HNU52792.1 beta-ketoacyl-[acyl-carrier-protein] synthase family protein [Verrucomicrobiota bacterium]